MATLAGAVSDDPTNSTYALWTISADLDDGIDYLQVGSEIVRVVGNFPAQYQAPTNTTTSPKIRVERGAGGTAVASHADGATLTLVIPPSAGGGAAEPGTVVVTPGSEDDIAAALEGANAMSGANPAATLADVSGIMAITRTLTAAEILTLNSVPIEILAGQAGQIIWPQRVALVTHAVTTPFTYDGGPGAVEVYVGTGGGGVALLVVVVDQSILLFDVGNDFFAEADMATQVSGAPAISITDLSGIPLKIRAGADLLDGDGTVDVTVFYRLVDVS